MLFHLLWILHSLWHINASCVVSSCCCLPLRWFVSLSESRHNIKIRFLMCRLLLWFLARFMYNTAGAERQVLPSTGRFVEDRAVVGLCFQSWSECSFDVGVGVGWQPRWWWFATRLFSLPEKEKCRRQWQRASQFLPTQRHAEVRRQLLPSPQLNLKPVNQLQKEFYSLSNPLASLTFGSVLRHLGNNH